MILFYLNAFHDKDPRISFRTLAQGTLLHSLIRNQVHKMETLQSKSSSYFILTETIIAKTEAMISPLASQ